MQARACVSAYARARACVCVCACVRDERRRPHGTTKPPLVRARPFVCARHESSFWNETESHLRGMVSAAESAARRGRLEAGGPGEEDPRRVEVPALALPHAPHTSNHERAQTVKGGETLPACAPPLSGACVRPPGNRLTHLKPRVDTDGEGRRNSARLCITVVRRFGKQRSNRSRNRNPLLRPTPGTHTSPLQLNHTVCPQARQSIDSMYTSSPESGTWQSWRMRPLT